MTNEPEREETLRTMQLESFGRIMAGFSHEMKNHLSIIRESNGLIADILEFQGIHGEEVTVARLTKAVNSVERRVAIAAEMLHHLSGFAHRTDTVYASFNLNELLAEECVFLERFSRLKRVEFTLVPDQGLLPLYNNPALLQHLVYRLYMFCLEHAQAGGRIELKTSQQNKLAVLSFLVPGVSLATGEGKPSSGALSAALDLLGASLRPKQGAGAGVSLTLSLPSLTPKEAAG
ncbi:sensor histidine kinase [Desulfogranum mediterraneum]|uniref:sensor histidine kinase n=1 Tax=Desulfogranum mediterraneum TaxID=160661 RepID=UPI000425E274|nr:hypothetical protein [Desulfogranum mediterraneum]